MHAHTWTGYRTSYNNINVRVHFQKVSRSHLHLNMRRGKIEPLKPVISAVFCVLHIANE